MLAEAHLKMGLFISPRQSCGGSNVECQVLDELLEVLETMTQLMLSTSGFGIIYNDPFLKFRLYFDA